jgi:CHAD domain-containing protein
MAYAFSLAAPLDIEVRRIALENLDTALEALADGNGSALLAAPNRDERIHDTRKLMKELRGLLRLVRRELGDAVYREENACYRDVARRLADARDAAAVLEALDALTKDVRGERSDALAAAVGPVRQRLETELGTALAGALDAGALGDVAAQLRAARERVAAWPISQHSWRVVERGLRKVYAAGRRGLSAAARPQHESEQVHTELLHEWRKVVKYQWFHTRLLANVWPEAMRARRSSLKHLSDRLGDDHDLAELTKRLASLGDSPPESELGASVEVARELAAKRRATLQAEACHLGQLLFAERPRAFSRRVHAYYAASTRAERSEFTPSDR